MIAIISGTNRPNSKTLMVAQHTANRLQKFGYESRLVDLKEYALEIVHDEMYNPEKMSDKLAALQDNVIIPADKWIVISPEYNGSFSGILKLFLDALSIRKYGDTFKGKKVALVGVASGRAGNLRGMEHLTGFLNYLKMHVYPVKVPISQVVTLVEGDEFKEDSLKDLDQMIDDFLNTY